MNKIETLLLNRPMTIQSLSWICNRKRLGRGTGSSHDRWTNGIALRFAFASAMLWSVLATIPRYGWADDPASSSLAVQSGQPPVDASAGLPAKSVRINAAIADGKQQPGRGGRGEQAGQGGQGGRGGQRGQGGNPIVPAARSPMATPLVRKKLNLFGAEAARASDTRNQPDSPNIRKTRALITEYINVSVKLTQLKDEYNSVNANLVAKENRFRGLEKEFLLKKGELAGAMIEMERLRPNLALGKQHPQSQKYYRLKQQAQGLQIELNGFPALKAQLPREITGLRRDRAKVLGALQQLHQQSLSFVESWATILNPLAPLAPHEAEEIATLCGVRLIEHPDQLPIQAMQGCARLHLKKPEDAISDFEACLKQLPPSTEASKRVRHRCQMGLLWACIQAEKLDRAGAMIASLKKQSSSDYELRLCEASLLDAKGQEKQAWTTLERAKRINKADPTAYRMAADLLNRSSAPRKSIETAISEATKACQLDEKRDFRNQLTLAHAYHQAGDFQARDRAIQMAKRNAGMAGLEMVLQGVRAFEESGAAEGPALISNP